MQFDGLGAVALVWRQTSIMLKAGENQTQATESKPFKAPDWLVVSAAFLLTAIVVDAIGVFLDAPILACYAALPTYIGSIYSVELVATQLSIFAERTLRFIRKSRPS